MNPPIEQVADLSSLYSPGVVGRHSDASAADIAALGERGRATATSFAPARAAEFATARRCARAALRSLGPGADAADLGRSPDGAPEWPPGFTGSITHNRGWCAAVAGAITPKRRAIGLDAELIDRFNERIADRILEPVERARIESHPLVTASKDRETGQELWRQLVAVSFAAKEAFYKAQHQLSHTWLGFDAVQVEVLVDGRVEITCAQTTVALLGEVQVGARWLRSADRVVVGVELG